MNTLFTILPLAFTAVDVYAEKPDRRRVLFAWTAYLMAVGADIMIALL